MNTKKEEIMNNEKKMGITRPCPDGGVMKKMGITRPRPDGGVMRLWYKPYKNMQSTGSTVTC